MYMIVSKQKILKLISSTILINSLIFNANSFAQISDNKSNINSNGYKIIGTIKKTFKEDDGDVNLVLLKVNYQDNQKSKVFTKLNTLKNRLANLSISDNNDDDTKSQDEPTQPIEYAKVDLGMANVPVLDQGPHGSCVTFAVTAALNARFNAGDYISQQCILALGNAEYSHNNDGYDFSGWNGLWADIALNRIRAHGVVNKVSCPDTYPNPSIALDKVSYDYLSLHKQWATNFTVKMLSMGDINAVKAELDNGHRVLFATLLNIADKETTMGYNLDDEHVYGYWRFPETVEGKTEYLKQIINQLATDNIGAHEMVIIGYDDELKRFKIRNSWGTDYNGKTFADHGNFYMSYEFYELMNLDAQALV